MNAPRGARLRLVPRRAVRSVVAVLSLLALQLGVSRSALGLTCGRSATALSIDAPPAHAGGYVTPRGATAPSAAPLPAQPSDAPAVPVTPAFARCSGLLALVPPAHGPLALIERAPPATYRVDRINTVVALDPPFHPPRLT